MNRLFMGTEVIPEHRSILEIRLWITLLCVNENREFGRITDEEDWRIVVNPIPITFLGIELDREPTGVAGGIWASLLATNCC